MADYNKYIGVKFSKFGRTLEGGVDCYGLAREIIKNEFGKELPVWNISDFTPEMMKAEISMQSMSHFRKVETPEPGDIGVFQFYGLPTHVGVFVGDNRIIHIMIDEYSVMERLDSHRLNNRLVGWYEYTG